MSTIETYKQEIEAELDLTRKKLVELKTKIRSFSDVERLDSLEKVEGLEQMANDLRTKIKELNVEMEDSLEQIKGDINSSKKTIDEAFEKLNSAMVI
jgi:chromosome segregation ATPase